MELSVQDWLVGIGALLIVGVLLDAYRRYRSERRNPIRVSRSVFGLGGGFERDDAELPNAELPTGGARVRSRADGSLIEDDDEPEAVETDTAPEVEDPVSVELPEPRRDEAVADDAISALRTMRERIEPMFAEEPRKSRIEPSFDLGDGDGIVSAPRVAVRSEPELDQASDESREAISADDGEEAAENAVDEPVVTEAQQEPAAPSEPPEKKEQPETRASETEKDIQPEAAAAVTDADARKNPAPEPAEPESAPEPKPEPAAEPVTEEAVSKPEAVVADDDGILGAVRVSSRRVEPAPAGTEPALQTAVGDTHALFADEEIRATRDLPRGAARPTRSSSGKGADKKQADPAPQAASEVLVLHVVARRGERFSGDVLKKIFEACDVRHGDMGIFHRHEREDGQGPVQFSIANAVEPGYFDLATMDTMSTPGLSFFMQLPGPENPLDAFNAMFETARVIVRNLDGEMLDETRSVFTQQTAEHCRERIRKYSHRSRIAR